MSDLPRSNFNNIELRRVGNGEGFSASAARFGDLLGMERMGCSIVELAPGEKGWPFHLHYGEEELFVVIEGTGLMRYGDGEHSIGPGDVLFTPPGEGTAHQIINNSSAPLRYLAMSTHADPAMCYYPDSGKYAAYAQQPDGSWKAFIAHESSQVDYYEGE
ncbi:cupin domain-containing protein [Halioglobus maricola]|uniref:cupin domain-containing protein n=1 Tax=Halioglobus maricola TaxID=2601894 RepID=UPI0014796936|nr:cupin domain-containing protein [Halioglobus maricola]